MAFNYPISTLGIQRQTSFGIGTTQNQLATLGGEIASGVKSDVARDIGSRVGSLIDFRASFEKSDNFIRSIDQFQAEAQLTQTVLVDIEESVVELQSLLAIGVTDTSVVTDIALQNTAQNILEEVTTLLNTTTGSKFLFAGVQANIEPIQGIDEPNGNLASGNSPRQVFDDLVADWEAALGVTLQTADATEIDLLFTGQAGPPAILGLNSLFDSPSPLAAPPAIAPDNTYRTLYNGSDGNDVGSARVQTRIDDGTVLQTGIQADDAAFRNILAGLYFVAHVDPTQFDAVADPAVAPDSPYARFYVTAINRLETGLGELRLAQSQLGQQQQISDDIKDRHTTRKSVLNGLINELEQINQAEASVRFSTLENQLTANFEVTRRLLSLRLTNFL